MSSPAAASGPSARINGRLKGRLTVIAHRARDLQSKQMLGTMDPYVVVNVRAEKIKSSVHKDGGRTPKWEHFFVFNLDCDENEVVHVKVMNKELVSDDTIGIASIAMKDLVIYHQVRRWYQLVDKSNFSKIAGALELTVDYQGDGIEYFYKVPPPAAASSAPSAPYANTQVQMPTAPPTTTPMPMPAAAPTPQPQPQLQPQPAPQLAPPLAVAAAAPAPYSYPPAQTFAPAPAPAPYAYQPQPQPQPQPQMQPSYAPPPAYPTQQPYAPQQPAYAAPPSYYPPPAPAAPFGYGQPPMPQPMYYAPPPVAQPPHVVYAPPPHPTVIYQQPQPEVVIIERDCFY